MKYYIIILIICQRFICYSQNPYYDAQELSKLNYQIGNQIKFQTGQDKEIFEICMKYTNATGYPSLQQEFSGNPFISFPINSGSSITNANTSPNKSLASSIGGLNVSNVADGLAKFLVARTKQELSITFFDKFKEELNTIPELRLLFPNSKKVFDAIDTEIYMYSNYLNLLREAFKKDLDNILVSLDTYIVKEHSDKPNIIEPFSAGLFYTNQVKNGIHPAEAASNLSKRKGNVEDYESEDFRKFIYALKVFDIFSQSLKSTDKAKYWIPSDSLNLLFDETTLKIYAGLLYQKHKEVRLGNTRNQTFGYFLTEIKDNLEKLKEPIRTFIGKSEELQNSIKSIKEKKSNGDKIDSYFGVFSSSTKLIGESKVLANALEIPIEADSLDKYLYVANLISEIYTDINEARYNALVLDIVSLSDTLNFAQEVFQKKIFKYGSFVANVAQAENSDQVQAAIEAIALPVGSASIKRKTISNISLNAYVGLSPGGEFNGQTGTGKFVFGVYTPVGVAFNWGKEVSKTKGQKTIEKDVSNSLFLSVVDITAFSTFRFNDSETSELPEVSLSNIFAPGLYYVHGMANIPVSWGIGAQLGPQLRSIDSTMTTIENGVTFSGKFFIAVDIPIINFFTKSK